MRISDLIFLLCSINTYQRSLACSIATQEMCEAWLTRNEAHLIPAAEPFIENLSPLDGSTASVLDQLTAAQEENSKSAILNQITPSLPLLSTWVTARAQEALYKAFKIELASQADLIAKSLANKRDSAYMRPLERDLFTLQAKMHRAEAEIELYTLAIENTHEFNFSDNIFLCLCPRKYTLIRMTSTMTRTRTINFGDVGFV
ncbi:hypothetical protein F4604DRAFT_1750479 [Suillus subluteus]|nr:hypothetical protein F4604DRAFT_1750479 [Suillus subluteus]